MKRLYWGVGIVLAVVLCLWQWQGVHASTDGGGRTLFFLEYYRKEPGYIGYEYHHREQVWEHVNLQHECHFTPKPSKGYKVTKWKAGNREYSSGEGATFNVRGISMIYIYEEKNPNLEQKIKYFIKNPGTGKQKLHATYSEKAAEGDWFRKKLLTPEPYCTLDNVLHDGVPYWKKEEEVRYKVTGATTTVVIWKANASIISFRPEGGNGSMPEQKVYATFPERLKKNCFEKKGYRFLGWEGLLNGKIQNFRDEENVDFRPIQDGAEVTFKAKWEPLFEKMFLEYVDSENVIADKRSKACTINEKLRLPTPLENEIGTFLGWSVDNKSKTPDFLTGKEYECVTVFDKADKAGCLNWKNKEVTATLYSVWDLKPALAVTTAYIPEGYAKKGKITLDFLKRFVKAVDTEDGLLPFNEGEGKGFRIVNYKPGRFLKAKAGAEIFLKVKATDSCGNDEEEMLKCIIVGKEENFLKRKEKIRFIDEKNVERMEENSVWRKEEGYRTLLENVLKQLEQCAD